jgi:hypothetical protein
MENAPKRPALEMSDDDLLDELQKRLGECVTGDPYSEDGSFAQELALLPKGLRAMAATHWLDVSLSLDSLTWHFGNFGEPGLVQETEAGLRELGLSELAAIFCEARDLMTPILVPRNNLEGDPTEILEKHGLTTRGDEIDRRAWELGEAKSGKSVICDAWVRYARSHPELVFGD